MDYFNFIFFNGFKPFKFEHGKNLSLWNLSAYVRNNNIILLYCLETSIQKFWVWNLKFLHFYLCLRYICFFLRLLLPQFHASCLLLCANNCKLLYWFTYFQDKASKVCSALTNKMVLLDCEWIPRNLFTFKVS